MMGNGKFEIMKNWNKRWKCDELWNIILFFPRDFSFSPLFCGDGEVLYFIWIEGNEMMKLMTYRIWIIWIFNISSA